MTGPTLNSNLGKVLVGFLLLSAIQVTAEPRYAWETTIDAVPMIGGQPVGTPDAAELNVDDQFALPDIEVNQRSLAAAEAELRDTEAEVSPSLKNERSAVRPSRLVPVSVSALPVMSMLEAMELTLANNPEVGAALAREEQARWFHRESKAYKYPIVDVVSEFGPEYNRPATNTADNEDVTPGRNLNLRVTQLLYDGGVSASEEARRFQVRRSTEIETRLIVEDLAFDTVSTYLAVLQFQQAVLAAEEFVIAMRRIVEQIEVMHQAGAASKLELDFARARLASAQAETGNTAAQLNNAVSDLEFLTGDLADFQALEPQSLDDLSVGTLEFFLQQARENNAEILLNKSNKSALQMKIRGEQQQYYPILSINFGSRTGADEGGNQVLRNTSEVKLKAEYFIYDGGVRRSRINRSKAQLRELDWEDQRLMNRLERNVKQAYNQITTNRITLNATQEEIRHNLELRRLNEQNLELGDISIIELIEVEERLFNSKATLSRISSEMLQNYYALLIEVGHLDQVIINDLMYTRLDAKR